MSKLLYILGAIDVLGNPLNVLQELFGGYKNLVEDDNKIEGTKILIGNGIGAITGFASKITGSLSNALTLATMDNDYILEKKNTKYNNRPKNSGDGVLNGVKSFAKSIYSGIKGTVVLPYQGFQEDGVTGFIKGGGKGIIGLVLKPISGLIDVVSIGTEGIRNHVSTYYKKDRLRLKRVL